MREYGDDRVGVLASFVYDDLGRRTSLTYGNGVVTSYTYDNVSRLASLAHAFADTTKNLTLGFHYNNVSQIDQATRSNDLYSWTGHGTGSTSSSADGLNRLSGVGSVTPTYDSKGNMTSDGRWTYSYDSENHMTGAAGRFYYDSLGHLAGAGSLSGSSPQIYYDWYGDQMLAEHLAGSATGRRHVFGPWTDEPLVWYEGSGTSDRRFTHADERGSIIAVTDSSGVVRNVNTYDEYGRVHDTNDYYFGRFEFTGQRYFGLDLYDFKNRIYHPGWGRFMQTDPIGYGDGMNMYGYVGGDPVNFTDPTGLKPDPEAHIKPTDTDEPPIDVFGRHYCGAFCTSYSNVTLPTPSTPNLVPDEVFYPDIQVTGQRRKPQSGHYYDMTEQICRVSLSRGQRGQINRATALPDGTISPGRSAGTYPVGGWLFGIIPTIGGYVTTRFSADGNIAVNTTTSAHLFVGTITRTIYSNSNGTFIRTVGSGNAGSGVVGRTRDEINAAAGPEIFRDVNGLSQAYAKELDPSC